MVDGYVDTPGREDGTWIEDARVRALIAARWFGDSALRRLTIRLHAESQTAAGRFHCFPPSNYPLPACGYDWSLQWVAMLYDDYMWTGRTDLVERYWDNLQRFWSNRLAQLDPGGGRLRVEPHLAGLPYVSGHTVTPKGTVWVYWDGRRFDLDLPAGVKAEVHLPGQPVALREQ
jgi:hypothetical protein